MYHRIFSALLLLLAAAAQAEEKANTITNEEKQAGWRLLFDGKSTTGWMTIKREPVPERNVQDGSLNPHPCNYMLIYDKPLDDFVLAMDFKLSPKCNSGIFLRTWPLTPRTGRDIGYNGIEVAVDDTKTADFHDTGAIYDLVKPTANAMKPAGEWNHIEITCDDNRIEVVLNGQKVTHMDLDEWTEINKRPDGTPHKFDVAYRDHPRKGYIGIQDHGSDCWYRNIKLKPIEH
jgi:hypothetical protein